MRRLAISTLITLALLELVLHLLTGNLGMPRYDIHPADGRCVGLSPSTAVAYTGWALRVPEVIHDVNPLGYRGAARDRARPPGTFRILMVGDSFVYGQAVTADQTMAAYLEQELSLSPGQSFEVLNLGVPGLNLEENVDQYVKFGSRWQHDLVLMAVSNNDLGPPICDLVSKPFTAWVIKRSRLARLVYFTILHPFDDRDFRPGPARERITKALSEYASTSAAAKARVAVLLLHQRLDGAEDRLLEGLAAKQGAPELTLEAKGELPRIAGEFHFSAEGNRLAAERIAAWLRAEQLLTPRTARLDLGSPRSGPLPYDRSDVRSEALAR